MIESDVYIGELARRTGASRRSIRHYEQRGLLSARRTGAGWRVFADSAVVRSRMRELAAQEEALVGRIHELRAAQHDGHGR